MAPKVPTVIKCETATALEYELRSVRQDIELDETEETWDRIGRALQRLEALIKGSSPEIYSDLVIAVKALARPINNSLLSERSRLSGHAMELVTTLAISLRKDFDPLIHSLVPTLLLGAARSNSVFVSRSKSTLSAVVEYVQSPSLLPHFRRSVSDKSSSLRITATECVLACLNQFNPPDLESPQRAEDIEAIIKATATDAKPEVRKASRSVFEAYKLVLPNRVDSFVDPMTPVMRRYLAVSNKQSAPSGPASALSSSLNLSGKQSSASSEKHANHRRNATVASCTSKGDGKLSKSIAEGLSTKKQADAVPQRERQAASGPIRPPLPLRHTTEPMNSVPSTSTSNRPFSTSQSFAPSRTLSVQLSRPTATGASSTTDLHRSQPAESGSRTAVRRPIPHIPRPISPDMKSDTTHKFGASRPHAPLELDDLRKPADGRRGPRRVPKPATVEVEESRQKASAESARVSKNAPPSKDTKPTTKPLIGEKRSISTSVDDNVRKKIPKLDRDAHASSTQQQRPSKPHSQAVSQPEALARTGKEKKDERKNNDQETMPPPPPPPPVPRATRAGLMAPTLAQLARMKEASENVKRRQAKTSKKPMTGSHATVKPLQIRKREMKAVQKKADVASLTVAADSGPKEEKHEENVDTTIPPPNHETGLISEGSVDKEDDTKNHDVLISAPVITPPPDSPESSAADDRPTSQSHSSSPSGSNLLATPPRSLFPLFPLQAAATPISALLFSIERGFIAETPAAGGFNNADDTLPYPEDEAGGAGAVDEEEELKGLDFSMDGMDPSGKILRSPRKKQVSEKGEMDRKPLGHVDTNCA